MVISIKPPKKAGSPKSGIKSIRFSHDKQQVTHATFSYNISHFYPFNVVVSGATITRIKDVSQVRGSAAYGFQVLEWSLAWREMVIVARFTLARPSPTCCNETELCASGGDSSPRMFALVSVQANIASSDKVGSMVDVVVSSLGDATSLSRGTLTRTLLFGPDQTTPYATVQGPIAVGGFTAGGGGAGGASIRQNHPLVGQIVRRC